MQDLEMRKEKHDEDDIYLEGGKEKFAKKW